MARRPNVLLVTTDQQRYDTLAPHAPAFLRTPHLDLLRHEGVTFDRAYAQTPICVPARMSLLTGQSPFRHGLTTNGPSSAVAGRTGTLVEVPLRGDTERERRAHGWPGLHTETYDVDVRH